MAICRCLEHLNLKEDKRREFEYTHYALPLGYPNSSIVCGLRHCTANAVVLLNEIEVKDFHKGIRVFRFKTLICKVFVGNDPLVPLK